MSKKTNLIHSVETYYTEKIELHGASPSGVDWNGEDSQHKRFEQFLNLVDLSTPFSLLDYGCGYGALLQFLKEQNYLPEHYMGFDISSKMLEEGKQFTQGIDSEKTWFSEEEMIPKTDYVVASGIFNVMLEQTEENWKAYILETIEKMFVLSKKGMAFNVLTSYSDEPYKKKYLHYSNPMELFDFCKRKLSRNVALLHDYDLYEFTLIVRH